MNEPIVNSVHHLHLPYTIAIQKQWLTPGVSNCMVFNFKSMYIHIMLNVSNYNWATYKGWIPAYDYKYNNSVE